MFVKKCEICGNMFDATNGNAKYCSDKCRTEGTYNKRQEWISKSGYYEKQRHKAELRRLKVTEEQLRERKKREKQDRYNAKRRQEYAISKRLSKLQERADAGDITAKFQIAIRTMSPTSVEYWNALKEYELAFCKEHGFTSRRVVNDISIHDDYFEIKVVESILERGRIVSSTY